MNENEVLSAIIDFFIHRDFSLMYRTDPQPNEIGGVDAILFSPHPEDKYYFIEAKGTPNTPQISSRNFTNAVGSVLKRIRIVSGYSGNEAARNFLNPEFRNNIAANACHRASYYILALTPEYLETLRQTIDSAIAGILNIRVFKVEPMIIQEFFW
jgi:hypothetical protein